MLATMADPCLTLEWRRPLSRCGYCVLLYETVCIVETRVYIVCLLSAGLFVLHGLYVLSCIHVSLGSASVCVLLTIVGFMSQSVCLSSLKDYLLVCMCFAFSFVLVLLHYLCACYFVSTQHVCVCVRACVWFLYNSVECLRLCVRAV